VIIYEGSFSESTVLAYRLHEGDVLQQVNVLLVLACHLCLVMAVVVHCKFEHKKSRDISGENLKAIIEEGSAVVANKETFEQQHGCKLVG
jgi:hypothetical protein